MLKKTLLVSCFGLLLLGQNVQAGESAQNGLLGGAAGGAILGQVIGRNTEGTLIGTAIGGMLGYMVGNEMEKEQVQTVRNYGPPPRVVHQYEDDYPEVQVRTQVYERPVVYYRPAPVVRQMVIIDRDYDYHPRHRGHGRGHWQEGRYRSARHGYSGRDRACDNTRIIFR